MTVGPIEHAYLDMYGVNGIPSMQEIMRAIDSELAILAQRIDKVDANSSGTDARMGTVSWVPVTPCNPTADGAEYLLVLPSGAFCIGKRRRSDEWNSFFSAEKGWVRATHFARIEGPKR